MGNKRLRWLGLGAAALLAALMLWSLRGVPPDRIDVLRAAFEQAAAQCYARYRGEELRACLAGAMEAHLHALGGGSEEDFAAPPARAQLGERL